MGLEGCGPGGCGIRQPEFTPDALRLSYPRPRNGKEQDSNLLAFRSLDNRLSSTRPAAPPVRARMRHARTASAVTAAGDDRKAGECGSAHRIVKRSAD